MTLIDGIGKTTTIPCAYCFSNLFSGNKCVDARNLSLPATTLLRNCYSNLLNGCSELIYPPQILPATTLATYCYTNFFMNDTKLIESPILPAPALLEQSYYGMFYGCSALKKITCYATTGINTNKSTESWVYGAPTGNTGNFYKASSVSWPSGVNGIPTGWTIHTSL